MEKLRAEKEKKALNDQQIKLYFNGKGERVEPDQVPDQVPERRLDEVCNNVVNLCCISTVPDGFVLDMNDVTFCTDVSELNCCLENMEATAMVPNPCDGVLECPTEIQAVRLVGCVRFHANVGPLEAKSGISSERCTVCCDATTCVDQVFAFTCGATPPCKPCFGINCVIGDLNLKTDDCGRQILVITVEVILQFIGCDDC